MSNATHQAFASSLRTRRHQLGLSQEDVAQALAVAGRTVQRWEGGETGGYRRYLIPLADVLRTSQEALLGQEDHPEAETRPATPQGASADVEALRGQVQELTDEVRALRRYLLDPEAVRREAARLLAQGPPGPRPGE